MTVPVHAPTAKMVIAMPVTTDRTISTLSRDMAVLCAFLTQSTAPFVKPIAASPKNAVRPSSFNNSKFIGTLLCDVWTLLT